MNNNYVYILISEVNSVDTLGNIDNITMKLSGVFSTNEKAKQFVEDIYGTHSIDWCKDALGNETWYSGGSYGTFYTISKQEVK